MPDAYPVFELPEKAEEVLEIVDQIPEGKVLTYGDVAELVGSRGARFVGNVMSRYGSDVPWWRVVRSGGWPPRGSRGPRPRPLPRGEHADGPRHAGGPARRPGQGALGRARGLTRRCRPRVVG